MITVYVCVAAAILLAGNVIAKKSSNPKIAHFFEMMDKPLGVILIAFIVFQVYQTIPVWDTRAKAVVITEIASAALFVVLTGMYLFRAGLKKAWESCHKAGAVLLGVLLLVHTVTYFVDLAQYKEGVKTIELTGVTAAGLTDGSYIGQYDVGYINAKVEVVVENENIKEINLLEHNNERGGKAESIISNIIEKQTTDVDAVSGATNSSMVIKKAVENALAGK